MTDKISIAIDMDDVLAGTTEKMVLSYNTLKETNYIPDDLLTLDLETVFDETTMMQLFNEINTPGFTRDLVVKENAIESFYKAGNTTDQTVYAPVTYDGMAFVTNLTLLENLGLDATDANGDNLPDAFDTWEKIFK